MPWPLPAPHPPPSDRHRRRRAQSRKPSSRRANKEPPRRSDGSRSTSVERALPWPLGHISALRNQDITKKNCILEYFTYLICVLSHSTLSYLPLRGEVDARGAAGGARRNEFGVYRQPPRPPPVVAPMRAADLPA